MTPPIGIFGGTFDPVHFGHLRVADEVRRGLSIGDFRLIPAGDPPHRRRTYASPKHRLAMLELAIREYPGLRLDTREMDRPGPSFMVDTLASLRAEHALAPLLLIIGQDSANQLTNWHRWREILACAHLVVISRPGRETRYEGELGREMESRLTDNAESLGARLAGLVLPFRVSAVDISSTEVRRLIAAGEDTRHCLPVSVAAYIAEHGLYA
jgi:nicotinate-nucleotide adenylyltransferase